MITMLITALIFLCVRFAVSLSKSTGLETVISNKISAIDSDESGVRSLRTVSVMAASIADTSRTQEDELKVMLQKRERARFIVPERSQVGKIEFIRQSVVESPSRLDIGKSGDVNLDRLRYLSSHDRHQVSSGKRTPFFVVRENSSIRIPPNTNQREEGTYLVNHMYEL